MRLELKTDEHHRYVNLDFIFTVFLVALDFALYLQLLVIILYKGWWNLEKALRRELRTYPT